MIYNDKKFIGKTLQTLRKKQNIKQNELAEKIGISEKHLSKIETGKNLPSLDNFLKMAEILNFNLDDFGINTQKQENITKQNLLKMIYSASDFEADSYQKLLNTFNEIINIK